MPLPPALQARLAKRGLLKNVLSEADEEIIAEDYDENEIDYESTKNENLPLNWYKVVDPDSRLPYYWNAETDMVSWLAPADPLAVITKAAKKIPATDINETDFPVKSIESEIHNEEQFNCSSLQIESFSHESFSHNHLKPNPKEKREEVVAMTALVEAQERSSLLDLDSRDEIPRAARDRRLQRREEAAPYQKGKRGRDKKEKEELDPMDPSAYSDAPRGNWSAGLQRKGDAKTGADTTASGPLFQQRPYPSPGAVLRANAEAASRNKAA
uniref:Polyglutamine-binding protein 1 n=1 Tax=Petromyzon marinus TaxID=7757 RepID=S4RZC6_PETMA